MKRICLAVALLLMLTALAASAAPAPSYQEALALLAAADTSEAARAAGAALEEAGGRFAAAFAQYAQGLAEIYDGDMETAAARFEALAEEPEFVGESQAARLTAPDALYQYALGRILEGQGDIDGAIDAYMKSGALDSMDRRIGLKIARSLATPAPTPEPTPAPTPTPKPTLKPTPTAKPTAAPTPTSRPLQMGDVGETVRKAQRKLVQLYLLEGVVDGKFGEDTRKAVLAFQQRRYPAYRTINGKQFMGPHWQENSRKHTGILDAETLTDLMRFAMTDKKSQAMGKAMGFEFKPEEGVHLLLYEVGIEEGEDGELCIVPSVINLGTTGIRSIRFHMRFLSANKKPIGSVNSSKESYTYCDQECDLEPGKWINDLDGSWTGWHYNLYKNAQYVQVWIHSVTTSSGKKKTVDGPKVIASVENM